SPNQSKNPSRNHRRSTTPSRPRSPSLRRTLSTSKLKPSKPPQTSPAKNPPEMPPERLQKILAHAGIASRRQSEDLIREGRVRVNGTVITELGTKADLDQDHIKVDGKLVRPPKHLVYLAFHKPKNCMTTTSDPEGRETVMHLIKGVKQRVYPVG